MRYVTTILAVLMLSITPALPATAADQEVSTLKSFKDFYWEPKKDFVTPYSLAFRTDNDGRSAYGWVMTGAGMWLGGWHNDLFLLGNASLNLVVVDRVAYSTEPTMALGFSVAPFGLALLTCDNTLFSYCGKMSSGDVGLYVKPTYTYLVGLNGQFEHQNAFSVQVTFAWR